MIEFENDKMRFRFEKSLERKMRRTLKTKNKEIIDAVFNEFYDYYSFYVYRLANEELINKNDVYDLMSEVFLKFYNSLLNKTAVVSYRNYLFSIYNNTRKKYDEKYVEYTSVNKFPQDIENISINDSLLDLVSINEIMEKIDELLTPLEKEVFISHVIRNKSLSTIKKELKLEDKDIYKLYQKGLEKLQEWVGGLEHV